VVVSSPDAGGTIEIERKYLLRAVPALPPDAVRLVMEQGYLPGRVITERLRRTADGDVVRHHRTVKGGRGIARIELEEECDAALFAALWPLTVGRRLTKVRYRVPHGALVWEIDVFTDRELVLAEVELPAVDAAVAIPAWLTPVLDREVTGESAYVNAALAR